MKKCFFFIIIYINLLALFTLSVNTWPVEVFGLGVVVVVVGVVVVVVGVVDVVVGVVDVVVGVVEEVVGFGVVGR
jgi:hypothetical protein